MTNEVRPLIVRPLLHADASQVIHLLKLYHEETMPAEQFDVHRAATLLTFCFTRPEEHCGFVATGPDDALVGFIFGGVVDKLISRGSFAEDKCIFVLPAWRRSTAAYRLGTAFLKWVEQTDADYVRGEAPINSPIMKAAGMAGYKTIGHINRREIRRDE